MLSQGAHGGVLGSAVEHTGEVLIDKGVAGVLIIGNMGDKGKLDSE